MPTEDPMNKVSELKSPSHHIGDEIERKETKKIFVLDTNVLIHDPSSIFRFDENDIVIPFVVIEELDRLKKGPGEIAASARKALRIMDSLRERGSISSGITLKQGGVLSVSTGPNEAPPPTLDCGVEDNQIISTALSVARSESRDKNGGAPRVILVSKDTAVRIKAESFGLNAEDYKNDKTSIFKQYGKVLNDGDYRNGIHSVRYLKEVDDIYRLRGRDDASQIRNGKS